MQAVAEGFRNEKFSEKCIGIHNELKRRHIVGCFGLVKIYVVSHKNVHSFFSSFPLHFGIGCHFFGSVRCHKVY